MTELNCCINAVLTSWLTKKFSDQQTTDLEHKKKIIKKYKKSTSRFILRLLSLLTWMSYSYYSQNNLNQAGWYGFASTIAGLS